jgi:hypothetical protein
MEKKTQSSQSHYAPRVYLDEAKKNRLIELYQTGKFTVTELARMFEVSVPNACRAIKAQNGGKSLVRSGDNHYGNKTNPEMRAAIRRDREAGMTYAQLHAKYGVANCSIHRIINTEEENVDQ